MTLQAQTGHYLKKINICSQNNWLGFRDSVGDHDFRRGNAAFNRSHENTG